MNDVMRPHLGWLGRATTAALLVSLLGPGSLIAQPVPTGTLIGTVVCGVSHQTTTTPRALIAVEGTDLTTHTDVAGRFTLVVPALEPLTINAVTSPDDQEPAVRVAVSVDPGETLDIGALDLALCPPPAAPAPTEIGPEDQMQSVRDEVQNNAGSGG